MWPRVTPRSTAFVPNAEAFPASTPRAIGQPSAARRRTAGAQRSTLAWLAQASVLAAFSAGAQLEIEAQRLSAHALDLEAAPADVLDLVNRDRSAAGLEPVVPDETAERAAKPTPKAWLCSAAPRTRAPMAACRRNATRALGGHPFVLENARAFSTVRCARPIHTRSFEGRPRAARGRVRHGSTPTRRASEKHSEASHPGLGVGLAQPLDLLQRCVTHEFDVRSWDRRFASPVSCTSPWASWA